MKFCVEKINYHNQQNKNNVKNQSDTGCPQLPGTFFRIYIKPGFVINLLNIIEISSPAGICLIVRLVP